MKRCLKNIISFFYKILASVSQVATDRDIVVKIDSEIIVMRPHDTEMARLTPRQNFFLTPEIILSGEPRLHAWLIAFQEPLRVIKADI